MKLVALDLNTKNDSGIYYYEKCLSCGDLFFYRSKSLLKAVWDKEIFDFDFRAHKNFCQKKTGGSRL